MNSIKAAALGMIFLFAAAIAQGQTHVSRMLTLDIAAQPLSDALGELAKQAGLQIVFHSKIGKGLRGPELKGRYTAEGALDKLLENTGLEFAYLKPDAVAIRTKGEKSGASGAGLADQMRVAMLNNDENDGQDIRTEYKLDEDSEGRSEILVKGKRSLNSDIRRTEDDPQPYVVFEKDEIQRSQAINLEDFLRTRLPMNAAKSSNSQVLGGADPTSSVDLRGLGTNQTLILIDGRQLPGINNRGKPFQADLNGIPIAAIERIEVLPSSASAIYGGRATGGVINVILRRGYQGIELAVNYANTFDTDAASTRIDASGGFSLNNGKTQILVNASRLGSTNLTMGDRAFTARAIALQLKNNPARILRLPTPPLGHTVNVSNADGVYNDDFTEFTPDLLSLDSTYGGTILSSGITTIPIGYAGPSSDNGAALAANAGRYNLELPPGVLGEAIGLTGAPALESAALSARHNIGNRIVAFLDISQMRDRASSFDNGGIPTGVYGLPADAPNNPFQQDINVSFPVPLTVESRGVSTTLRASGGLIVQLPLSWMGEIDYGWSQSRFKLTGTLPGVDDVLLSTTGPLYTGLPANDGRPAINVLQEQNTYPIDFTPYLLPSPNSFIGPYDTSLRDVALRMSGPVVSLPGGPIILSSKIERSEEALEDGFSTFMNLDRTRSYRFSPERSQRWNSYYLEARLPLLSAVNHVPLVRETELQLSVRNDKYRIHGYPEQQNNVSAPSRDGPFPTPDYYTNNFASTDYMVGLRISMTEDVALRGSFSTGFLPPTVTQIGLRSTQTRASLGTDPKRGFTGTYVGMPVTRISGGNPDLGPEQSKTWSYGVILTPRAIRNFRISVDYTEIAKSDEIQTPDIRFLLDHEDEYPGRIIRGQNFPGDPVSWAGPITAINMSLINIAKTSVKAYDVQVDYTLRANQFGDFHAYAVATRTIHTVNQIRPIDPKVDRVGYANGPLSWRGNVGVDWENGPFILSVNSQYYGSYLIYNSVSSPSVMETAREFALINQGSASVPRQLYHDMNFSYRFSEELGVAWGFLTKCELSVGIQNIFNTSPPIIASSDTTTNGYSTYGDPRLRRYSLSIRKTFN